jgi:hypothetical protein
MNPVGRYLCHGVIGGLAVISFGSTPESSVSSAVRSEANAPSSPGQFGDDRLQLTVIVNWNTDGQDRMLTYSPAETAGIALGQIAYLSNELISEGLPL